MPPNDVLLELDSGQVVTADANTVAIETEGGFFAIARLYMGAMSGASTTFDARLQYSKDGGLNYYMAGKCQQLGPTNDNAEVACVAYIPPATTPGAAVLVRLNYDVGGSSPSYAVSRAFLQPLLSTVAPAVDVSASIGVASALAAV